MPSQQQEMDLHEQSMKPEVIASVNGRKNCKHHLRGMNLVFHTGAFHLLSSLRLSGHIKSYALHFELLNTSTHSPRSNPVITIFPFYNSLGIILYPKKVYTSFNNNYQHQQSANISTLLLVSTSTTAFKATTWFPFMQRLQHNCLDFTVLVASLLSDFLTRR